MNTWKKVALGGAAVAVLGFGGMAIGFSYPLTEEELVQQFVLVNPLDLSQISAFSQYRSCAGHDFRGPSAATGKVESSPRSLKHYMKVKQEFRGTKDKVVVFAPFDGIIFAIDDDFGGPDDKQIWLTSHSKSPRQWHFIFFHIKPDPVLRKGSSVIAGQKIGTANLARGPEGKTDNFDIAMKFTRTLHVPAVEPPFNHFAPSVLAEYERYGITPAALTIAEEVRDANPCPVLPKGVGGEGPDLYFPPEAGSKEYIFLKTSS